MAIEGKWDMNPLIFLVRKVTGKDVVFDWGSWGQTEREIEVPEGDLEGLLHELGHWVVASPTERKWPNLLLDEWQSGSARDFQESMLKGWLRKNYSTYGRSCSLERAAVYFQWRCLNGVLVETKEECIDWLKDHCVAGGSAHHMNELLRVPKAQRRACNRVSRYMPYRGLVDDVKAALRQCTFRPGEE